MRDESLTVQTSDGNEQTLPITWVHTLVIGTGAAGLNAAVQLKAAGVDDLLIVTEGLQKGTSINTGSDKQTYYKLSLCGADADSPGDMAQTYYNGGGMHGDQALVEASLSARGFINLVNLGVPFPRDPYGQFVGYKTDHDPRQRATSIGPYTSKEMCWALIRQIKRLEIPVREDRSVVELITHTEGENKRVVGAVFVDGNGDLEVCGAENVVLAVGGPAGLYKTVVYPDTHVGAIGLAMLAGARSQNLPESQYGLASTKYRWNVSGTYMQVIPRFVSTEADGTSDPREFMREYFDTTGQMNSNVFLKGYQWPFDSRKIIGGSSIVDLLVYIETMLKGRRVYLDFRANPEDFRFEDLSPESLEYLQKSQALQDTPIERLRHMNPGAIELYATNGIDITTEPLEIAVCAQHNNGGIAANHWWESVNLKHLFPVGEINGCHGVYRPGGASLNAGQVGGFRVAEYIANRYAGWSTEEATVRDAAQRAAAGLLQWIHQSKHADHSWQEERDEYQSRMSKAGSHIRVAEILDTAVDEAWQQVTRVLTSGCRFETNEELIEVLRNRHSCYAHAVYLEAVQFALTSGVGSRGSAMVVSPDGTPVHDRLDDQWRIAPEEIAFRNKVQETRIGQDGHVTHRWVERRPIPQPDHWFETAWARFRNGEIYDE